MDRSIKCDCGNNEFWFFLNDGIMVRCKDCLTEYKFVATIEFRRYNGKEQCYHDWSKYVEFDIV